jgi:hypothetical protein
MEWLKSLRLGGSRRTKRTKRFKGKGPGDPEILPLRPEDNYPPRTLPLRPEDNYPVRTMPAYPDRDYMQTMPGRPGSYIPPVRPERSGMGGRSRRSRRYRRAGGPEPDEAPIGMMTPSTNPAPQPQVPSYLPLAAALAFPRATALALTAQAAKDRRKGGRSRRSRRYR